MKVFTFIYIISNLIILQLVSLESDTINYFLQVLSFVGIITLGIAHGSLDNILYGVKSGNSNKIFLLVYVLLILAFIGLWAFSSNIAFLVFMLISAYHFGQSQLEEYRFKPLSISKILYVLWGGIILLLPIVFNSDELMILNNEFNTLISITTFLILNSVQILIGVIILFILTLLILFYYNQIKIIDLLKEAYILSLIVVSFKLLPPFIAFSLFFVFIHSLKVIIQEYHFCYERSKVNSIIQFIKLCLPLTILSIIGIFLISLILYLFNAVELIPFALIIILSGITFPHSIVMEKFYTYSK